jgi:hypothetical protein
MTVDPRQERYAQQRFEYTSVFRAWFREKSEYEVMWLHMMLEPEDIEDVHRGQRPQGTR